MIVLIFLDWVKYTFLWICVKTIVSLIRNCHFPLLCSLISCQGALTNKNARKVGCCLCKQKIFEYIVQSKCSNYHDNTKATVCKCSTKWVFSKILGSLQGSICVRVPFLTKFLMLFFFFFLAEANKLCSQSRLFWKSFGKGLWWSTFQ